MPGYKSIAFDAMTVISSVMHNPRRVPSMSPLIAFEATARLCSVTLAAEELNTSQSAISRHIRNLETRLSVQLFQREGRGISLTSAGRTYQEAVISALTSLQTAERRLTQVNRSLTIACSYSVSHLLIMPRYSRLRSLVGEDVTINVLTSNYEVQSVTDEPNADIVIGYKYGTPGGQPQKILTEEVIPVASPEYIARHKDVLDGPIESWSQLRFLEFAQGTQGWSTWQDWFRNHDVTLNSTPSDLFSNYVYLLEAAASGTGVALGWRGFFERFEKNNVLQTIGDRWMSTSNCMWAWSTQQGQNKKSVNLCMQFLSELFDEHSPPPQ